MCQYKEHSEYVSGPKYAKILNMTTVLQINIISLLVTRKIKKPPVKLSFWQSQ